MKHLLLGLATVALFATSCKKESVKGGEMEEVSTTESDSAVTYALDSAQSVINWQGYKISDGTEGGHYGTIQFQSSGEFSVKDSTLVSGSFSVNMGSLVATDIEDEGRRKELEVHLKNQDFFKVEDFPEAKFEITEVNVLGEGEFNTEIKGNFSIKDQTKNYAFKANTSMTDSTYSIKTEKFSLNRQEFGINYQSSMEDVLIKDNIDLQIDITGMKK